MCAKIDKLVEASAYDPDHQLAPYEYWPTNRDKDLNDWLTARQDEAKKRSEPAKT